MTTTRELTVPDASMAALVQCLGDDHEVHGSECVRAVGAPVAAEVLRQFVTGLIADDRVPRDVIAAGFNLANHLDAAGGPE